MRLALDGHRVPAYLLEHAAAQITQFFYLFIILRIKCLRPALQLLPLILSLLAVSLGIDCLVVVIGLHFLFVIVVPHHAEDAEEGVADCAEGFGFFLMLLAYLELDILNS